MPLGFQVTDLVVPLAEVPCCKDNEGNKGCMDGDPGESAIPGKDGKDKKRRRERNRKREAAKGLFQGWIQ